ncbi:hypothetical protein [Yinghuangia seranimata]|uniref:hypothetical protein n=1 Tax=Yinghuangia seranimata TaxID=408067 RepID=UPI00248AE7DB|nr:hypothetical protein [Yinghuangia seranimata]MDI2128693.1 hypothetical protein [Yinghuangia seranimata]
MSARPRTPWVAVACVAVLAAAGCGQGGVRASGTTPSPSGASVAPADSAPDTPASPSPSSPSSAPASVARVGPEEFRAALAAVDAQIAPGMAAVEAAGTPQALASAFTDAARRAGAARTALAAVTPPEAAEAGARTLTAALSGLEKDLDGLSGSARSGRLCTGASGIPRASNLPGAQAVRDAAAALAAVDGAYRVGSFVPERQDEPGRRGANGSLGGGRRGGPGELTVKNADGAGDAVVELTKGDTIVRELYVRAGATVTVDGIPDGKLTAYYTTGTDWDPDGKRFSRDCRFQRFDETLDFETKGSQYMAYTLTLYAVAGGNASKTDVSADQFPS